MRIIIGLIHLYPARHCSLPSRIILITIYDGMVADLSVIPVMVGGYRNPTAGKHLHLLENAWFSFWSAAIVHPFKSLASCPVLPSVIFLTFGVGCHFHIDNSKSSSDITSVDEYNSLS